MNAQKESLKKTYEKVCDENESRRIRGKEKNDGRLKYILMEGRVYKAYACAETRVMDIKRLQVNDSSYIEGSYYLFSIKTNG